MAKHTITVTWDEIPADADPDALVGGAFRGYRCDCGLPLDRRVTAELHAMENDMCSTCLGAAEEVVVPGFARPCTACASTGRRGPQLVWQAAYGEAEQVITIGLLRRVVRGLPEPFALSRAADEVRALLGLPPGRLPVGPRVRDLLQRLAEEGEIALASAPDELLHGTEVVLYRDPLWRRVPPPLNGAS
ncbi:hypothetical protein C1I98_13280 [Spongiactinospora gelatinilytica]|uniref:Uncharacterized protein n=1 Tax=Spongiactinospora gelatinilytica TaxID=2666298 RepID=A0A2W2GG30_9ACTN|nr:hypothetical protein [Spongiactinospora gelatinilytica]PZG47561.1 hypothetical protein C1I98_13280 [Spongiactinospora gelatinilytica]